MNNIKPCPFCGSIPKIVGDYYSWIQCDKCGAHQFAGTNKQEVIDKWNNRVNEMEVDDGK